MTTNQIAWYTAQNQVRHNDDTRAIQRETNAETKRSNLAREYENYRSNLARESETHRANVANERLKNDANIITLTKNVNDNLELQRHNRVTEQQSEQKMLDDWNISSNQQTINAAKVDVDRNRLLFDINNSALDLDLKASQIAKNYADRTYTEAKTRNETATTGINIISSAFKGAKGVTFFE